MYFAWEAANNNVILHTIGLGPGVNHDLLTAMATGTDPRGGILGDGNDVTHFQGIGGQYYAAPKVTDMEAVLDQILGQIPTCNQTTPGFTLTKTAPAQVEPNQILTYTIIVENHSPINVIGVVITDALDSLVNFISASDGGSHDGGIVSWKVGAIAMGHTITRTLRVTVNETMSGTTFTNTAWMASAQQMRDSDMVTTTILAASPPLDLIYLPIIVKE
jgi:uncharacterized repeat protein (TIGR01451 family)